MFPRNIIMMSHFRVGSSLTLCILLGTSSWVKIDYYIVQRELTTLDWNRRAVGMLNYLREKEPKAHVYQGGEGTTHLFDYTARPEEGRRGSNLLRVKLERKKQ